MVLKVKHGQFSDGGSFHLRLEDAIQERSEDPAVGTGDLDDCLSPGVVAPSDSRVLLITPQLPLHMYPYRLKRDTRPTPNIVGSPERVLIYLSSRYFLITSDLELIHLSSESHAENKYPASPIPPQPHHPTLSYRLDSHSHSHTSPVYPSPRTKY